MLQKLPSRKSPCSPLFAPLSSRMELFHRPNTGFLCFPRARERPAPRSARRIKEGARKRTADIDCSRAWRSPFFPPPLLRLINRRHQIRGRRRRPLLLFLDRSDRRRCCMVLYCPMPCCRCCLFRMEKEGEREGHGMATKFSRNRGAI